MSKMGQVQREYRLSIEKRRSLLREMRSLLVEYKYNPSDRALLKIIDEWAAQKGWLINLFSTHPNWNPDKFQIQFSQDFTRSTDLYVLNDVLNWGIDQFNDMIEKRQIKIAGMTYAEAHSANDRMCNLIDCMSNLMMCNGRKEVIVNGFGYEYYLSEKTRIRNILDRFSMPGIKSIVLHCNPICVNQVDADNLSNLLTFSKLIRDYFKDNSDNLCPSNLCEAINEVFPDTAREGLKISKIIAKVYKKLGLDKIKDMREVRHNGVLQMKDYGWQKKQAELGDAINPIKYTRHTIISLNPIDYLTMSFGNGWASCHTIDVHGIRTGNQGYSGEYSAGTVSYMLDNSSLIFYTVSEKYDGSDFELEDKMQRVVFALGEDKLYEGRVYPDGRDGGEQSLASQFRNVMQKIVADCLGANNVWLNKKGTTECSSVMKSNGGLAYEDWKYYSDCNMSFLKGEDGKINDSTFHINAAPICIETGERHNNASSITSYSQEDCCEYCGGVVDRDGYDTVYISEVGYFCDVECAENAGYRYCNDVDEWQSVDECYYDEYTNEYFYDDSDMVEIHEGWNTIYFSCPENAERGGYIYVDNLEEWICEDDAYSDDYSGELFGWEDGESIETEDGNHYMNADNAESDGYVENEDGEWVKEDEMEEVS